ncbi:hypothetical protein AAFF_G00031570 [Aldrovandia affinis]|uniref:Desmoplakin-like n=1 Tax=Aldrovandia affinis TaxID=143900 RepID=A0AAD7S3U3_9TELE|nr:hypothetical protein AAFF_G00031570 [Aldrovandia affinis]
MLMKVELEQKSDVMRAMDRELSDTMSLNSEVGQSCPKCELDLSKYSELVGQTSDRWRRLHGQIDNRLLELGKHGQELSQYHKNSSSLSTWINNTRQRQDALQGGKFDDVTVLMEHLNQQKALNCEIKGKREQVEDVVKDASTCAASIKDYELQLASYSAGLETLLNIPIKRTMLQSPATIIMEEASDLQVHYIELLARSNDYYKFLGVMLKNMEELKMRNTRIDLLEEELRLLREGMDDTNQKNQSLADALAKYELELSQSKDKLLSMEEVKMSQAIECSAARENLSTTADEVADLNDRLARLTKQLEEEQRRRRLLEETYTSQQEEYELIIRKRQKELEEVSWAKVDIEKTIKDKEREIERLRMELDDEALRKREREAELSKVRNQYSQEISNLKETYESEIHVTKTHILKMSSQKDEDSLALQLQYERLVSEKRDLEDELKRLRLSMSEVEELRRRSEEELRQQKSAGTEESRNRKELVVQIETIVKERNEDHLRHKEALAGINRTLQDKNKEIALLTQNLEEECRKRRALEAEISSIKQVQIDLKTRYESSLQIINKLKVSEEEVSVVRVELAKQSSERSKAEKSVVGLQSRIKDLQKMFEAAEAESEAHKKTAFEEANRRKRVESELERVKVSFKEHTTTISVLKKQQEETTSMGRRSEQELKNLQDNLDKSLRDHKATTEKLIQLSAELKALQQQLVQEQARVREANLRNETLYKTIEEKSKLLNDNATEIEKLQSLTQNLTKERLKLEEEVRALRQERDELKNSNESSSRETIDQISSLRLQLQSSSKVSLEYKGLIEELSREREKLKLEIEKIQKQALETSGMIQESQAHYDVVLKQRDSLQLKIKLIEQEKLKMQQYGEELSRVKVTLESELRLKQRLQEENNQIRKDFEYWKSQYELKESLVRQHESEKGKMEKDRDSLRMEVERLLSELKLVEERYKIKLQSTETEMRDLASLRDSLEAELRKLRQRPDAYSRQTQTEGDTVDAGALLFDGIRRKVTAHQLCDCGIIDKVTLGKLLKGEKTVPEVALNIRVNLKGTGVIAGVDGPEGRMSFTELRNKELLTPESASKLLEAQAATGFIIDPRANEKMSVDVAVTKHLVDFKDRDMLLTAENACTGFKDPASGKFLSAGQAMKKGWIDRESVLRLLQAQECVGGIIDPVLSVFLPKDAALDRDLIDEELYSALNKKPRCYIDPATEEKTGYVDLKKKCRTDSATGLLLLPAPEKPITVKGLRRQVSVNELVESQLLEPSDVDKLRQGKLSSEDIEIRLRQYLQGSTCIAGIFDEANDRIMPIYQAMKEGLLRPGSTLELLEAQAASGFVIDPINNLYLTVEEACKKGLFNKEYKQKLLSAERAVTGYKDPETGKLISLFQAIDMGLIEKGHGIRLLEAQIASGGIIDPKYSHRIDVDVAYKRGYFDKEMNDILCDDGDDTKGFFDPNTQENLTYLQLKSRCITDKSTGLVLLPIKDKKKQQSTQKNTLRKRRVVIVDPDTNKEMTVKEAYDKQLIDYETFLELSGQECEWEEITITAGDGTKRYIIIDRKTGIQYDIEDSLEKGLIDRASYEKYRSGALTLTQFADTITSKARPERPVTSTSTDSAFSSSSAGHASLAKDTSPAQYTSSIKSTSSAQHTSSTQYTSSTQQHTSSTQYSSSTQLAPPSPTTLKHIASVSITLASASEVLDEQSPVAAIFDSEKLEKISIAEALDRGLLDSITAQRLLEAQACTGGIINHTSGKRLSVQEAARQGIIGDEMATRLKPAQKAYLGFEDVKTKRKMSAVEAMKERWLPYEAGQRFLEFQYVTGGLIDPEVCQRRTIEDVIQRGWLDGRAAQKLQDTRHHTKNLTCPKTKLKISYKEAMDNCMVEEDSGLKMLQATSVSSKGISSPYNVSSAPGSKSSSRTGSRSGSRRGSVDMSSRYTYSYASFSSRSVS